MEVLVGCRLQPDAWCQDSDICVGNCMATLSVPSKLEAAAEDWTCSCWTSRSRPRLLLVNGMTYWWLLQCPNSHVMVRSDRFPIPAHVISPMLSLHTLTDITTSGQAWLLQLCVAMSSTFFLTFPISNNYLWLPCQQPSGKVMGLSLHA